MQNFNLNDLRQWKPVAIGEILDFEMPSVGFRSVHFDVMAAGTVSVHAVTGSEEYWLVGYGQGFFQCKFSLNEQFGLVVVGDAETDVFIRSQLETPVIPESTLASYTTIEPRRAGPSEDFKRMMHMVKINQDRREAALRADLERRHREQLTAIDAANTSATAPLVTDPPAGDPNVSA